MKFKKSSNLSMQTGETSKLFLVLAVIILVAAVIVYLVIKMAEQPSNPVEEPTETVALPVYEQTLGNIKFIFESAINHGDTLYASKTVNSTYSSYQTDLTTTENFIELKVGAQNVGKVNMEDRTWDIENIVDSEGREYVPLDDYSIRAWLPDADLCGTLLKPSFDPTPCIKIYEVSKQSTGLKVRVVTAKKNDTIDSDMKDNDSALIDLIVK